MYPIVGHPLELVCNIALVLCLSLVAPKAVVIYSLINNEGLGLEVTVEIFIRIVLMNIEGIIVLQEIIQRI